MIYGVWIIHKDGKCLIFREYEKLNINEQLFSGFLVAILSFSKEISNRQLKNISLEDLTLYYENIEEKDIVFVIAADSKEGEAKIRDKIGLIEEVFFLEFGDILPDWNGNLTIFGEFDTKIDEIVQSKGHKVRLPELHLINASSFENFFGKIAVFCGKKNKKEIDELEHTVSIIDRMCHTKEAFKPPHFITEAPKKMKTSLKRLINKIHKKRD
ncbi:MAG: hypothetical protein ACFFD2_27550 [Promethearchaeota archaeon]